MNTILDDKKFREEKRKIVRNIANEACNILLDYGSLNTDEYKQVEAKAIRQISTLFTKALKEDKPLGGK